MKHATLGASSAARWLACPGSPRLIATVPPQPSGPYAEEGTAAHALGERLLLSGQNAIPASLDAMIHGEDAPWEMREAVQVYLDTVRTDKAALSPLTKLLVETKFDLNYLGRAGMFGTNDAMLLEPFGALKVYDYKHGQGVAVEAKDNAQMMYYALGALGAPGAHAYDEVELVIVQPRAIHRDGPVRRHKMSVEALTAWGKDVLLPGAAATDAPDAPLAAGKHCRFCPALAVCPAQRANAIVVAQAAFAPTPESPALPNPEALTPADLKTILDKADFVEGWFAAIRAFARHGLETGSLTPEMIGQKLVSGRASRTWTDEAAAEKWLRAPLGEEVFERKLLSPAKAEKKLNADGKKAMKALVTEMRGIQMVPVSDSRDAITVAALAFDAVPEAPQGKPVPTLGAVRA